MGKTFINQILTPTTTAPINRSSTRSMPLPKMPGTGFDDIANLAQAFLIVFVCHQTPPHI
jgi:hypothetical protein